MQMLALLWMGIVLGVTVIATRISLDEMPDPAPAEPRYTEQIYRCSELEDFLLRETWSRSVDEACADAVEWLIREACNFYDLECERTSL